VNVLVLCMQEQVEVTLVTVRLLLRAAEPRVVVSVLVNGGSSAELRRLAADNPSLRYHESATNLGVAGGRNLLLRADVCRAADLVMILDNDVIPPVDYVRNLAGFLLRHPEAGVVGGVVADLRAFTPLRDLPRLERELGGIDSAGIRAGVMRPPVHEKIYHMGVSRDYHYAYFSIRPKFLQILGFLRVFALLRTVFGIHVDVNPNLRKNSRYLKLLADGVDKYEVSNVVGCSQAFRRDLLQAVGFLDERFNPYGFEDVDFCIRAQRAGYRNYIDTGTWVLHGTDGRHGGRDPLATLTNNYRCRTILATSLFPGAGALRLVMMRLIVVLFLIDLLHAPRRAISELRCRLAGYRRGLEIVGQEGGHG